MTVWLSGRSFSILSEGIVIALRHSLDVERVIFRLIVSPFFASITFGSNPLSVTFTSTTRPVATSTGAVLAGCAEEGLASFDFPQPSARAPRRREATKMEGVFTRVAMTSGASGVKTARGAR